MTTQDAVVEIKRLEPKPGDVIVVQLAANVDKDEIDSLAEALSEALPDGVNGILVDGSIDDVRVAYISDARDPQ